MVKLQLTMIHIHKAVISQYLKGHPGIYFMGCYVSKNRSLRFSHHLIIRNLQFHDVKVNRREITNILLLAVTQSKLYQPVKTRSIGEKLSHA